MLILCHLQEFADKNGIGHLHPSFIHIHHRTLSHKPVSLCFLWGPRYTSYGSGYPRARIPSNFDEN